MTPTSYAFSYDETIAATMQALRCACSSVELGYCQPDGEPFPDAVEPSPGSLVRWWAIAELRPIRVGKPATGRVMTLPRKLHAHTTTVHPERGMAACLIELVKVLGATVTVIGADDGFFPAVTMEARP